MKKTIGGLVLTGLLAFGVATNAHAEVVYDAATGTGFVGKGDVQLALNYNNAQMQANAGLLTFTQDSEDVYDVVVEWDTGGVKNQKHHTITQHKHTSLTDKVSYDAKVKKQVVGFNLTGIASTEVEGQAIPHVGDSTNDGNGAVVTSVTLVSHTSSNLKVNGIELTPPPVVVDPVVTQ
jgi:hypothetical protein